MLASHLSQELWRFTLAAVMTSNFRTEKLKNALGSPHEESCLPWPLFRPFCAFSSEGIEAASQNRRKVMNNQRHSLIAYSLLSGVLTLGIFVAPGSASAQSSPFAEAQIPFTFQVGKTVMPAGDYMVSRPSTSIIVLRNRQGTARATVMVFHDSRDSSSMQGSLIFNHYGDRYYFSKVGLLDSSILYKALPDKSEREARRTWHLPKDAQMALNLEPARGQ